MRTSLSHRCARFLDARDMLRRAFPFAHAQMIPICAGMAAGQDRPWDAGRLYACRDLIQEETGLFSNFRGARPFGRDYAAGPEPRAGGADGVCTSGLQGSADAVLRLPVPPSGRPAAGRLGAGKGPGWGGRPGGGDLPADEAGAPLSHRCGGQCVCGSAGPVPRYRAGGGGSGGGLLRRAETPVWHGQCTQALSHVLALGEGSAQEKRDKVLGVYQGLKAAGRKYGAGYELGTLGSLALLPAPVEELTADVLEVDEFLSHQKGYRGILGLPKNQRLMHSAMLVSGDYVDQRKTSVMGAAAVSGTVAMIAAQEMGPLCGDGWGHWCLCCCK